MELFIRGFEQGCGYRLEKGDTFTNESDPAGEDELALCNHNVIIKYNPTMEECHAAASGIVNATATANGNGDNVNVASTVEMQLKEGAITLHVGEELEDASDEENDE